MTLFSDAMTTLALISAKAKPKVPITEAIVAYSHSFALLLLLIFRQLSHESLADLKQPVIDQLFPGHGFEFDQLWAEVRCNALWDVPVATCLIHVPSP
jgi:hypothetical protein